MYVNSSIKKKHAHARGKNTDFDCIAEHHRIDLNTRLEQSAGPLRERFGSFWYYIPHCLDIRGSTVFWFINSSLPLKPTIHDATLLHRVWWNLACNKVACKSLHTTLLHRVWWDVAYKIVA